MSLDEANKFKFLKLENIKKCKRLNYNIKKITKEKELDQQETKCINQLNEIYKFYIIMLF